MNQGRLFVNLKFNFILTICVFSAVLNGCQTTSEIAQTGPVYKSQKLVKETVIAKPLVPGIHGEITFSSIPLISLKQFLRGEYRGAKSEISGFLSFPTQTKEKNYQQSLSYMAKGEFRFTNEIGRSFLSGLNLRLLSLIAKPGAIVGNILVVALPNIKVWLISSTRTKRSIFFNPIRA